MASLSPKVTSILAATIIVLAAVLAIVIIPSLDGAEGEGFPVVDMYGHDVIVPHDVENILALGVGALRFVSYLNCSDMVIATEMRESANFNAKSYMYANPQYAEKNTLDNEPLTYLEGVLSLKPDLIILTNANHYEDEIETLSLSSIPVVGILELQDFDNDLFRVQMRLLAKVLNQEARGEQLLNYLDECVDDLAKRVQDVPTEDKPSAYVGAMSWAGVRPFEYSASTYGPFDLIDAKNVIEAGGNTPKEFEMEVIISLNPDFIFIDSTGYVGVKNNYESDPAVYNQMSAFINDKVYMTIPFIWYGVNFDNILVGAYYLGTILYPEQFEDVNISEKADEIYNMWVGVECFEDMNQWFEDNLQTQMIGHPPFLSPSP